MLAVFGRLSSIRKTVHIGVSLLAAGFASCSPALSAEKVFDEVRFGESIAIDKTRTNNERGSFPSVTVFFDPFDNAGASNWKELLARPRIHLGAQVSTSGEASTLFSGVTWTAPLIGKTFLEAGFGATLHNGDLSYDGSPGPKLGCHLLFHESVALGYNITDHWRILAEAEHSSHANICGKTNNGLTRGGIFVGYKF